MTTTALASTPTRFENLTRGAVVRVPPARGRMTAIEVMLPPAKVLFGPTPCPWCKAMFVTAEDVASGAEVIFHRMPNRAVIVITETTPEA